SSVSCCSLASLQIRPESRIRHIGRHHSVNLAGRLRVLLASNEARAVTPALSVQRMNRKGLVAVMPELTRLDRVIIKLPHLSNLAVITRHVPRDRRVARRLDLKQLPVLLGPRGNPGLPQSRVGKERPDLILLESSMNLLVN